MKAAIDSHGGIKGCYAAVCKVDEKSQNMTKHSLSGIQSLNSFLYTESGAIIAWRAYNDEDEDEDEEEEESVIFGCPEVGCIKVYQSHSSLQRHRGDGKHLLALEREYTYDVIKKKWAETCKSISGSYMEATHPSTSGSASVSLSQSEDTLPTADMGWALKNQEIRSFHHQGKPVFA